LQAPDNSFVKKISKNTKIEIKKHSKREIGNKKTKKREGKEGNSKLFSVVIPSMLSFFTSLGV
jgi:hypothetical protein